MEEEEGVTGLFSLSCLIEIEEMEKDLSLIRVCILNHTLIIDASFEPYLSNIHTYQRRTEVSRYHID